jgi:hypothetical protein
MVWLDFTWDIVKGTQIGVARYDIKSASDELTFTLSFVQVFSRENVTGEIYMLRVREGKIVLLYSALNNMIEEASV